jgi:hypothetical protein
MIGGVVSGAVPFVANNIHSYDFSPTDFGTKTLRKKTLVKFTFSNCFTIMLYKSVLIMFLH